MDNTYIELFYEAASFIAIEDEDELVYTEGTNIQSFKLYRDAKKAYKEAMKTYRSELKAGHYPEARRAIDNGIDAINDLTFAIKSTKESTVSTIIGIMIPTLTSIAYMTVPALLTIAGTVKSTKAAAMVIDTVATNGHCDVLIPSAISGLGLFSAGYFTASIASIADAVNNIINTANKIKDTIQGGKDISFSDFNLFRNDLIGRTKKLKKVLTGAKERIDTIEKAHNEYLKSQEKNDAKSNKAIEKAAAKGAKVISEAAFDRIEAMIINAYANSQITESEYDGLIGALYENCE
jgi:hypothetical protein